MTTRIEINPNLRVGDGQYTVADLDEDVSGDAALPPGQPVEVYESTSGIFGRGWVVEVDEEDRSITVLVEWSSLQLPTTRAFGRGLRSVSAPALDLPSLTTMAS
jgi:hypothetical protein